MADNRLGLECVTAFNTATIGTPTWDVIDIIRDESVTMDMGLADVTTRAGAGWKAQRAALLEGSIDLQILYEPGHADFVSFQTKFIAREQVILGLFDGDITAAGTYQGLHSAMSIVGFSQPRNLEDAVVVDIKLTLDYEESTKALPRWETIVVS